MLFNFPHDFVPDFVFSLFSSNVHGFLPFSFLSYRTSISVVFANSSWLIIMPSHVLASCVTPSLPDKTILPFLEREMIIRGVVSSRPLLKIPIQKRFPCSC